MESTSPKNSLDWVDVVNLLKNVAIFFIPVLITILTAVQTGQSITISFLAGATVSSLVKLYEYYTRENK